MGLLHPRGFEVFQDNLFETLLSYVFALGRTSGINQFIVFINTKCAVWAKAFNGKGARDTNLLLVIVGLVE
jgi:hypothetical protein